MSWSAGGIFGPLVGGALLGWHPYAVWPIAAGVCVFSALGCLALERRLPEGVRRTPRPEPVTVTPITPPLDLAARAPVAQGIERAPPEREVAGSIPARRMACFRAQGSMSIEAI